jgi:2-polyprenyl-3-methyl-5-hydroxy-6-metoxy-1,4-benzoquinol methylase
MNESASATGLCAVHAWPAQDLETVTNCPYCGVVERRLRFGAVQDWTFDCAPGQWQYWQCAGCNALYLDPRPTEASIGRAYARYYTHDRATGGAVVAWAKTLLRHACYLAWYDLPLQPRLPLPRFMFPLLAPLRTRLAPPFVLRALNRLPRGRVVDVGCGNGTNLLAARQLGWDVLGIEIDDQAVVAARAAGIAVEHGDYRKLNDYPGVFDCLICSHVIEHVHQPLEMLRALARALKPGGSAMISLPNADSIVLKAVGDSWRGLEAPRHLAIPAAAAFAKWILGFGFEIRDAPVTPTLTLSQSLTIARQRGLAQAEIKKMRAAGLKMAKQCSAETSDFINLELQKQCC